MAWTVYCHTNKINGNKYVGITSQKPEIRWANGNGYKTQFFYKAIDKYGWEEFNHEILFTGLTEVEAKEKEIELISKWSTNTRDFGYNVVNGGQGTTGYNHTDEAKELMRIAHIGKKQSEQTKKRRSIALTGIKRSEETKEKMREYAKNRTEEHKLKLSKANIGNKRAIGYKQTSEQIFKSASKRSKKIVCIDTGEEYWGICEAGRQLGISGSLIAKVLRGERKHTHGLHFEYI